MNKKEKASRRNFLKTSAAMAALAGTLSVSRSAHAAGDDVIKVALIGCGRRGRGAILPGPDGSHETATAITGKYDPYN